MTTNAITTNSAALAAVQSEANAASRLQEERRKPAVEPPRDAQNSNRYADQQRATARAEGRGTKVDRDA